VYRYGRKLRLGSSRAAYTEPGCNVGEYLSASLCSVSNVALKQLHETHVFCDASGVKAAL
jgi:hypothetical protein